MANTYSCRFNTKKGTNAIHTSAESSAKTSFCSPEGALTGASKTGLKRMHLHNLEGGGHLNAEELTASVSAFSFSGMARCPQTTSARLKLAPALHQSHFLGLPPDHGNSLKTEGSTWTV